MKSLMQLLDEFERRNAAKEERYEAKIRSLEEKLEAFSMN